MVSRAPQHFDDPSYAPAAHLPLSKGANQLIPVVRRDQIPYTHSLFALDRVRRGPEHQIDLWEKDQLPWPRPHAQTPVILPRSPCSHPLT